jgi:hypothetical protein
MVVRCGMAGYVAGLAATSHVADDGNRGARNMLSKS